MKAVGFRKSLPIGEVESLVDFDLPAPEARSRGHLSVPASMQNLGTIDAANLRKARALVESGKAIGKVVLEGF